MVDLLGGRFGSLSARVGYPMKWDPTYTDVGKEQGFPPFDSTPVELPTLAHAVEPAGDPLAFAVY